MVFSDSSLSFVIQPTIFLTNALTCVARCQKIATYHLHSTMPPPTPPPSSASAHSLRSNLQRVHALLGDPLKSLLSSWQK
jgi:hypothetical protein